MSSAGQSLIAAPSPVRAPVTHGLRRAARRAAREHRPAACRSADTTERADQPRTKISQKSIALSCRRPVDRHSA